MFISYLLSTSSLKKLRIYLPLNILTRIYFQLQNCNGHESLRLPFLVWIRHLMLNAEAGAKIYKQSKKFLGLSLSTTSLVYYSE